VGAECVGGRGNVVTSWERRIGKGGEDRGRLWMRRRRKSSWKGEQWIVT
jgi:hypothetical protein